MIFEMRDLLGGTSLELELMFSAEQPDHRCMTNSNECKKKAVFDCVIVMEEGAIKYYPRESSTWHDHLPRGRWRFLLSVVTVHLRTASTLFEPSINHRDGRQRDHDNMTTTTDDSYAYDDTTPSANADTTPLGVAQSNNSI
jgi:hypothetical protein